MHSSTSNFERTIPSQPWRGLVLSIALVTAAAALGWELWTRAHGYAPVLNDTSDLWADARATVKPDSVVIIGDSRALFDSDLDALGAGLGQRPVQLALVGSCAYPILEDLANDPSFHGTIISSVIPFMWLAPPPSPPYRNSIKALKRYYHRTVAQRASHHLGMFLEEHLAFMKQDDLTLDELLRRVSVPDRAVYHAPPPLPPYFQTIARDRRTRMAEACVHPGPLQDRVKNGWLPLFTPPPPPSYVPPEAFQKGMAGLVEARFADTAAAVKKIQARGGHVIFIRYPMTGELKVQEDRITPRAGPWTRLIRETGAPGIYFEDYPELATLECPEWSHLSGPGSEEFTKRLVPHLKAALANGIEKSISTSGGP
jgi:hypothetical protein